MRPRRISDEALLDAAAVVIGRHGPGFTLAQVAERAGVSVGSVSGRFGSKHGLLIALTREGTARAVAAIRAVGDASTTPRQAVLDALVTVVGDVTDARTAAHHLGQLGVDIADPDLRDLLGAHYAALETELARLLRRLVPDSATGPDPAVAARVLVATANGALLDWSVRPRGELRERLTEDLRNCMGSWWT